MEMTPFEICQNYREAKNKREQIMILAQINCTDQATIKMILKDEGLELPRGPVKGQKQQPHKRKAEKPEEKFCEVKEVVATEAPAPKAPAANKGIVETFKAAMEEVASNICDHYCKYPLVWNEEMLGPICDSEVCKNCPLNGIM